MITTLRTMMARGASRAPWVTIVILIYGIAVLGGGLWLSIATGQWIALVLAVALIAPWESLWLTWRTRRDARTGDTPRK
jgi:glucose dehydrogenase